MNLYKNNNNKTIDFIHKDFESLNVHRFRRFIFCERTVNKWSPSEIFNEYFYKKSKTR